MRNYVLTWSTCQLACVPAWFTSQRACVPVWFTCQRVCVPTYQKRANFSFLPAIVPKNVRTCNKACQCFNLAYQSANSAPTCQRACQVFKHSSYERLREISMLYYYKKNSTLYLTSYLHISCVYVSCIKIVSILFETFLLLR